MTKLYVIVRSDLSKSQQAVQAGHVLAQWMLEHPKDISSWSNGTLIYLKVKDEIELKELVQRISTTYAYKTISLFWEPDINFEMTAMASFQHVRCELFENLPLL